MIFQAVTGTEGGKVVCCIAFLIATGSRTVGEQGQTAIAHQSQVSPDCGPGPDPCSHLHGPQHRAWLAGKDLLLRRSQKL